MNVVELKKLFDANSIDTRTNYGTEDTKTLQEERTVER